MKTVRHLNIIILCAVLAVAMFACSKSKMKPTATMEERMEEGIRLFEKGNYFDAKTQFRIITLSHSGSLTADKAQFYYAECHFFMKEYILSASEYERLIKVYPNSEYVDDSKYKLGLSYYKLSPKYSLDQEYTLLSITHFQEFLEDYHTSELAPEVEKYLLEARHKLAQKVFSSAEIYRKMAYFSSANIYYSKVIEEYYDTQFAPKALFWIGDCSRRQEKFQEALAAFDEFMQKNPDHEWVPRAKNKIKQTRREYEKNRKMVQRSGRK